MGVGGELGTSPSGLILEEKTWFIIPRLRHSLDEAACQGAKPFNLIGRSCRWGRGLHQYMLIMKKRHSFVLFLIIIHNCVLEGEKS